MTSNCLRPPTRKYADRLYTTGPVGFRNVPQVADEDHGAVIARSLQLPVFSEEAVRRAGDLTKGAVSLQTGFGHAAVLGVADEVVEAVKSGALEHVFVIGGCDGTQGEQELLHGSRRRDAARLAHPHDGLREVPAEPP